MAILDLSDGYGLMAEGQTILKIVKAEGKPKARPTTMAVSFENEKGEQLTNNYPLDPTNQKGWFVTSTFLKAAFGNSAMKTFDTDNIPALVGKYIDVDIKHNKVTKNDGSGELTFANIGKINGAASGFASVSTGDESDEMVL